MDEGGSRNEASLSEESQWRGPRGGSSFTGEPGRYVKKGSGYGHLSLKSGPFISEGNLESGAGACIPGTLNDE